MKEIVPQWRALNPQSTDLITIYSRQSKRPKMAKPTTFKCEIDTNSSSLKTNSKEPRKSKPNHSVHHMSMDRSYLLRVFLLTGRGARTRRRQNHWPNEEDIHYPSEHKVEAMFAGVTSRAFECRSFTGEYYHVGNSRTLGGLLCSCRTLRPVHSRGRSRGTGSDSTKNITKPHIKVIG